MEEQLPDQVVERRAQVVDDLADQDTPLDRELFFDLRAYDVPVAVGVVATDAAIGVAVDEPAHISLECTQVLISTPQLRTATLEPIDLRPQSVGENQLNGNVRRIRCHLATFHGRRLAGAGERVRTSSMSD